MQSSFRCRCSGLMPVVGLVPGCGVPGRRSPAGVLGFFLAIFLLLWCERSAATRTDTSSNKVGAAAYLPPYALPESFPGRGGEGMTNWVWRGEGDGDGVAVLARQRGAGRWHVIPSLSIHPPLSGRGGKGMEMATARGEAASSLLHQRGYWLPQPLRALSNLLAGHGGKGEVGDGGAEFGGRRWPYPPRKLHLADDTDVGATSGRFGGPAILMMHPGAQYMDDKDVAMIRGQDGHPRRRPVGASSTSKMEALARVSCRHCTPPGCEVICSPQLVAGGWRWSLAVSGEDCGLDLTSCNFSRVLSINCQDCFRGVFLVVSCAKFGPTAYDI